MTTPSRPITDYKKTALMMKYVKQYDELSVVLLQIMERFKSPSLTDDEIVEINDDLAAMIEQMNEIANYITLYTEK